MSPESEFLKLVKDVLIEKTVPTFVPVEENVFLGETTEFLMKDDSFYPRIELQLAGLPGREYVSQRMRVRDIAIGVQGYVRRATDDYVDEDMFNMVDFTMAVESAIYSIHHRKIAGDPNVPADFLQLMAMTEIYVVHEFEPRISMFLLVFTGQFQTKG